MADPLPPLSPVLVRAQELGLIAQSYQQALFPSVPWLYHWFISIAVRLAAEIAVPIFRRAQERVAQRTAYLVLAELERREVARRTR